MKDFQTPYDPVTLCERLEHAAEDGDSLAAEALIRIRHLERLCAMMTDTGVILEEDAAQLAQADWWWLPGEGEFCFDNLKTALREAISEGFFEELEIVEWCRSHQLDNSFAVLMPALRDSRGRILAEEKAEEFSSREEAEMAVAEYNIRAKRLEESDR